MEEFFRQAIANPYVLAGVGALLLFGNKIPWTKLGQTLKGGLSFLFSDASVPPTPAAPVLVVPGASDPTTVSTAVGHYLALRSYLSTNVEAQKALQNVWVYLEPKEVA